MANYRQIHVSIWKDEWFLDLDPREKLLFIYLFSNECTSLAGIYKIPLKVIAFETCLDTEYVLATIVKFSQANKVYYDNGIVWVVNMWHYHESKSPKVQQRRDADIASIPDCPLKIQYLYSMNTLSLKEEEEEEKKEEEEEEKKKNADFAAIARLYESEVGIITPMISDSLDDAISQYPAEWFEIAFKEAASHNARNWKYIEAILKNWKANGFKTRNSKGNKQISHADAILENYARERGIKVDGNQ